MRQEQNREDVSPPENSEFDYFPAFREGFLGYLAGRIPDTVWNETVAVIDRRHNELCDSNLGLVTDPPSEMHLRLCALVLAAYQVLGDLSTDQTGLISRIRDAFIKPFEDMVKAAMEDMLNAADDKLAVIVAASKQKEEFDYGESFDFVRERDDAGGYTLIVNKCFYHGFFVANGAPELTAIFCASDDSWSRVIDPDRHGISFDRPTTMGLGGNHCRFQFTKVPGSDG